MPRKTNQPANQEKAAGKFRAIMDSATALKVGVLIGGVIFGFWTNSIQAEQTRLKAELAEVKATAVRERAESQAQITTIKTKQDACEKRELERLKKIEEAAKRLPPSRMKREILTLTKPQQSGKVAEPLRAEEPLPKFYSDFGLERLPEIDNRYFDQRRTN